jgi:hypothetical protein
VEVGSYTDFDCFRTTVTEVLEAGLGGKKYPTLIIHSDSDGEWSAADSEALKKELHEISEHFRRLPAIEFASPWQASVAKLIGLKPKCLYDSFIDVDGEPLLERLNRLCDVAIQSNKPILFQ